MSKKEQANCDSMATDLMSVSAARQRIMTMVHPVQETERVGIRDSLNRILGEDIVSTINVPPYDNSAMDGYAVRAADLSGNTMLTVSGESFAGRPFDGSMKAGEAIRIMTGAMVPEGADTVIMQELVERKDDTVLVPGEHRQGENVRYIGEDMKVGETILYTGHRITAADLGLLASLGVAEVAVKRKVRVAFFSTGDELKDVGEELEEGQIYDSNRYSLHGMLKRLDVDFIDMGVIPDDREAVENAFTRAAASADAVITSGGVSVGEADFVKETLDKIGQVDFWRIKMKPGKPLAIGKIDETFFFGLPGNPVSAMATFYQFAQPALKKISGDRHSGHELLLKLPCKTEIKRRPGRLEYQRGILSYDLDGLPVVHSTGMQGSHILTSMSRANCFIIIPAETAEIREGDLVEVQPFEGII